jgi:hypothetical protein
MKISTRNVSDWVGNYGYSDKREKWMLEVIRDMVNGECNPLDIAEEIKAYNT